MVRRRERRWWGGGGREGGREGIAYCVDVHVAVPSQPDCFCAFCLLETAKIELQVFVVEVYRCNCCQHEKKTSEENL